MEHIALELQSLAETPVSYGKTRSYGEKPGVYNVIYSYQEERLGLISGWFALRIINSLLPRRFRGVGGLEELIPSGVELDIDFDSPLDLETDLKFLRRLARKHALGPTTRSLVDEAARRGIPHIRLDEDSLVQLGYGKFQKRIRASVTSQTSNLAVETAADKDLTKRLLIRAHLPAPKGELVYTAEEALKAAEQLGYPLVTKPLDGNHGRGITLNLNSPEEVRWGFEQAQQHSDGVIVEQQYTGNDCRALVVGGKLVAVAERVPAHVVGDGKLTIQQLIKQVNRDPRRGEGHEKTLTKIKVDEAVLKLLENGGLTLDSVPAAGQRVFLRETANLSTGGTAIDRTDEIHEENRRICERAARTIGLDIAGMDIVCPDIRQPLSQTGGGIVEVNAGPGFRMHLEPSEGTPRNVASHVIDMLFPEDKQLPIVAITGTNGKSTTSRMVAHMAKVAGHTVGLTTSNGIYVGGKLIEEGDTTGPRSARTVLMDTEVDFAVLETARGGMLREGLAFEECMVGAVLNVQEDHLGMKGIHTIEDLAWVKSMVIESVKRTGHRVLNADDEMTLGMREKGRGTLILFSRQGLSNPHVAGHVQAGGTALISAHPLTASPLTASQSQNEGEWLILCEGNRQTPLIAVQDIPATLKGLAQFNIENSLAAAAIGFAAGLELETITEALKTFQTSFEENPGRLNFYHEHPFTVLMDYAHNPSGLTHIGNMIAGMREQHGRVIGVLSGTGDRRDQDILQLGKIAGGIFDELIIKDDDPRGRKTGEAAQLLEQGAKSGGLDARRIHPIHPETEAVATALRMAEPRDLVVILVSDVNRVWTQIKAFDSGHWIELVNKQETRHA